MNKKVWTNEIEVFFNHDSINTDFDFYKVTTSDKYIKGGASFLDIDSLVIRSIVYERGNSFYVMTKKNTTSRSELIKNLSKYEDGEKLSLVQVKSKDIKSHLIVQLFLNSLSNPDDELCSYNNLSGKLFCYKPDWIEKNTNGVIWEITCLEIRVSDDMCVHLNAHKMTSLLLKNKMQFQKRKISDYPQYEFSYNNHTLRRVSKENIDCKTNFIQKPVSGEKGVATFFDFADFDTYSCTKMGILYDVFGLMVSEYSKYINIEFKEYKIDACLQFKRKELEEYKSLVANTVIEYGINLIDEVKTTTSEEYLEDIAKEIKLILPGIKASVGKRLSKDKLNIRYIHDKEYYDIEDPHKDDLKEYVVQHITVENFRHNAKAAVFNVLKELVIKHDIQIGKITITDWERFGFSSDWIFGTVFDKEYYFMKIHPDGSFDIEHMERNLFNMTEYDEYMDFFGMNEESNNDYRSVIGLVKDSEGNINLIKDTNKYSIPDFNTVGDILKNVSIDYYFTGRDLKDILKRVLQTSENKKTRTELESAINSIDDNLTYNKKSVMELIPGMTTKKEVVKKVYESTGIQLYAYLRGEESRNEILSGNIDINYINIAPGISMYCVGEVGNGMKYTIERSSIMREIQAVKDSELVFDKLLPIMGVEFVRYGMLTVMPFPFKYLREYWQKIV